MVTFSIIVPSIGRPSLTRTLASIQDAGILPGDEVLLVGDGPCPAAWYAWQKAGLPGAYLETPARQHDWGASPRNLAIPLATRGHLLFMDDDDAYQQGALDRIRAVVVEHPGRPLLFKMTRNGGLLWTHQNMECGNVSTQMFCCPNDKTRLAIWPSYYAGDHAFICAVCACYPEGPLWRDEVVADYLRTGPPLEGRPPDQPVVFSMKGIL
jgi:hypothetical protein